MALTVGTVDGETGLSFELFTLMNTKFTAGLPGFDPEAAAPALGAISEAVAEAIIDHIKANIVLNGVTDGVDTVPAPNAVT